jgi:NAD(P)-dependent dehydrogenase (short-subunit alcohol dehydrogenase family)
MIEAPDQGHRPDARPTESTIGRRFEVEVAFVTGCAFGQVAAVLAFLASDHARWITGHTLPIDGGFHAE